MNSEAQKELASAKYWDKRYAEEKTEHNGDDKGEYEWFRTYEKLRPFFAKHLPPSRAESKILQLGCGTSVRCA
jgi:EEF1A lysine methyltransferase 4